METSRGVVASLRELQQRKTQSQQFLSLQVLRAPTSPYTAPGCDHYLFFLDIDFLKNLYWVCYSTVPGAVLGSWAHSGDRPSHWPCWASSGECFLAPTEFWTPSHSSLSRQALWFSLSRFVLTWNVLSFPIVTCWVIQKASHKSYFLQNGSQIPPTGINSFVLQRPFVLLLEVIMVQRKDHKIWS